MTIKKACASLCGCLLFAAVTAVEVVAKKEEKATVHYTDEAGERIVRLFKSL